jgi:hypothetical protein
MWELAGSRGGVLVVEPRQVEPQLQAPFTGPQLVRRGEEVGGSGWLLPLLLVHFSTPVSVGRGVEAVADRKLDRS